LYRWYNETIKGNVDGLDEELELRKREFLDKGYFRYIIVVMTLSAFLSPFETYSRYPMKELYYDNISLLNNAKTKSAINHVCVMIDDALNLVPDVWKQIDYFKNKIK